MYVRLAFAVAAHLEPEILLVDEVLAVGDAAFQKKCLGKMEDVATNEGRTVLFVSHNMGAIARLCGEAILLNNGQVEVFGPTGLAVRTYMAGRGGGGVSGFADLRNARRWHGAPEKCLTSISLHDSNGKQTSDFPTGSEVTIRMTYQLKTPLAVYFQLNIVCSNGERLATLRTSHSSVSIQGESHGTISCRIPALCLAGGTYTLTPEIGRESPTSTCEWLDCVPDAIRFTVHLGDYLDGAELRPGQGVLALKASWNHTPVKSDGPDV
jgi:lipopolysaccharide transport system ATP-binding protein